MTYTYNLQKYLSYFSTVLIVDTKDGTEASYNRSNPVFDVYSMMTTDILLEEKWIHGSDLQFKIETGLEQANFTIQSLDKFSVVDS